MGEIADQMWDEALNAQTDFELMMQDIRQSCGHPEGACQLAATDYDETEDWLPYQCIVCGQRFDYP